MPSYLFRHRTVRHYIYAGFEFKDHELRLNSDAERDRFLRAIADPGYPEIERSQIEEINEEALAISRRSLGTQATTAVRGPMSAQDIVSAADLRRVAQLEEERIAKMRKAILEKEIAELEAAKAKAVADKQAAGGGIPGSVEKSEPEAMSTTQIPSSAIQTPSPITQIPSLTTQIPESTTISSASIPANPPVIPQAPAQPPTPISAPAPVGGLDLSKFTQK